MRKVVNDSRQYEASLGSATRHRQTSNLTLLNIKNYKLVFLSLSFFLAIFKTLSLTGYARKKPL